MRFEWDEVKNRRNLEKHKISFEMAKLVFDDPHALSYREREVEGEEQWQTLGGIGGSITVLVAHTYREEDGEEVIRIVSARNATSSERRAYEEGKWPLG
jgi:uncharacterized DUF497 family protein